MKLLVLALSLVVLPVLSIVAQAGTPRSFLDWCQDQSALSSVLATVRAMMSAVNANDCVSADEALKILTVLDLKKHGLSDLRPLTSLG